ncbi:DUF2382 domain-containing protein, partial [Bifidobacterium longum]|nr:DUF2382 domain-containing protein [Bifidobacterium longum]
MIERKPGDGAAATTDVNKRPVVREEVNIRKQEHEDMKQVSENVGREELDIDS